MASPFAITAIRESLPPVSDYVTYLTIVESHLSPDILPTLDGILQDQDLTQNIGWDLIQLLLPLPGSEACLTTIARLGNPREVVLKVTEALTLLNEHEVGDEYQGDSQDAAKAILASEPAAVISDESQTSKEPTKDDKFCILVSLLSILHPRIKTKYPSRFLSTSLVAVLSAYRGSHKATHAITSFVHALSVQKRPLLPQRKLGVPFTSPLDIGEHIIAPDPEATPEDPQEAAIQKKLLQSFVTHILEEYVKVNGLEWAARLQEHFQPTKIVSSRKRVTEFFKEDPDLAERDICVGQLVVSKNISEPGKTCHCIDFDQARAFDLGLSGYSFLFDEIIGVPVAPSDTDSEDNLPSSPDDVPLSHAGSLFLITSFIFSAIMFDSHVALPHLALFPEHVRLAKHFLHPTIPESLGTEEPSIIDALLAIGLWLEDSNRFVTGGLEDEEFLQHLQMLSLLSANTPSATLRYHAHILTTNILHAHPVDRIRLTFITDTLERCPYENLKASAVGWLKDEFIIASQRGSDNIFATTVALTATIPYLFPDMSLLNDIGELEILERLRTSYPFHMAVTNLLIFLRGEGYKHVVPWGMFKVAEEIYVAPLKKTNEHLETALVPGGEIYKDLGELSASAALKEIQLLEERLAACLA